MFVTAGDSETGLVQRYLVQVDHELHDRVLVACCGKKAQIISEVKLAHCLLTPQTGQTVYRCAELDALSKGESTLFHQRHILLSDDHLKVYYHLLSISCPFQTVKQTFRRTCPDRVVKQRMLGIHRVDVFSALLSLYRQCW